MPWWSSARASTRTWRAATSRSTRSRIARRPASCAIRSAGRDDLDAAPRARGGRRRAADARGSAARAARDPLRQPLRLRDRAGDAGGDPELRAAPDAALARARAAGAGEDDGAGTAAVPGAAAVARHRSARACSCRRWRARRRRPRHARRAAEGARRGRWSGPSGRRTASRRCSSTSRRPRCDARSRALRFSKHETQWAAALVERWQSVGAAMSAIAEDGRPGRLAGQAMAGAGGPDVRRRLPARGARALDGAGAGGRADAGRGRGAFPAQARCAGVCSRIPSSWPTCR